MSIASVKILSMRYWATMEEGGVYWWWRVVTGRSWRCRIALVAAAKSDGQQAYHEY